MMIIHVLKHIKNIQIVVLGIKVVCAYDDKYTKQVKYRGENAVYKFMEKLLDEVKYCKKNHQI